MQASGDIPPYGVTRRDNSWHFSVLVTDADQVRLCLFDAAGNLQQRVEMSRHGDTWQTQLNDADQNLLYCYEVSRGKDRLFLCDPFARNMNQLHRWRAKKIWPAPVAGFSTEPFDWQGDTPPRIPLPQMIIYEAHVKGLTVLREDLPEHLRGKYGGICHERLIAHLQALGVTTLELLPVHGKSEDPYLTPKGLTNYWGYNTLSYFAPESEYATSDAVTEFKTMVRELHKAGIEVILDVVYNHTGEGASNAPAVSFRGLAEKVYYRIAEDGSYIDYTHCGNSLNTDHEHTRSMVLQSLRYWAEEMHVDGFRFDLAPTIFRRHGFVDFQHELHHAILNDPILKECKLIAEPWDVGPDGYQRGRFPQPWLEWNDEFRDTARRFWKGERCAADLQRLMLSRGRPSIHYITCHDGFTLADLVSYEKKHNEANLEDNRDGADHNHSFNCGKEGVTTDTQVLALRARQARNLLLTLLFSQDIPMLLAGDEIGHTQNGNNNAYCQDNPISWIDWSRADRELLQFVRQLVKLRPVLLAVNLPQAIEAPTHPSEAFGIRFDDYLLLLNSARENVLFALPGLNVREVLHTGRAAHEDIFSGVFYLSAQSAVLCKLVH